MSTHGTDLAPPTPAAAMVVGAAIVHEGRLLAARRTAPAEVAGRWELPGGKAEPGEPPAVAAVREVAEELTCSVRVTEVLERRTSIRPGLVLVVAVCVLVDGEPLPHEHDAVRWLGPHELDVVEWLAPDLPFLPELRDRLLAHWTARPPTTEEER